MVWLLKSKYEKHGEKLRGKLLRIVRVLDSSELRQLCLNMVRKVPRNGLKLFDSDYNLIKRFSYRIHRDDYLLFFNHYHMLGKISDMKLGRYLIKTELFDENDPDYVFIKEFDKIPDDEGTVIIGEGIPRKVFPKEVVEKVLRLQRYRCAVPRCRFPRNSWRFLEIDHIKGRDDNSITNCQLLCPFHHRLKTKMEIRKRKAVGEISGRRTASTGRKKTRTGRRIRKTSGKFKRF